MNTTIIGLLVFANILNLSTNGIQKSLITPGEEIIDYVYTPNNSPVLVKMKNLPKEDSSIVGPLVIYENNTELGPSDGNYNCHSYAWYQQSVSNPYWMNNPSPYWDDKSYIVSDCVVGDRIVYLQNGSVIHSGIVDKILNFDGGEIELNDLQVISKWGAGKLYSHRGDECDYAEGSDFILYKLHAKNCSFDW